MKNKKVVCAICGKEITEKDAIIYTFSTCCGIDEVILCKECYEKNNKHNHTCGCY